MQYCRRQPTVVGLAVLLASLAAGCSDAPEGPAGTGQAEYRRHCATCHGDAGEGRSAGFPPLAGSEWLESGPESVALIALLGLRGPIEVAGRRYNGYMPPAAAADDAELAAAIGYIGTSWGDWPAGIDAGRIAELRRAVEGRPVLEGREELRRLLDRIAAGESR